MRRARGASSLSHHRAHPHGRRRWFAIRAHWPRFERGLAPAPAISVGRDTAKLLLTRGHAFSGVETVLCGVDKMSRPAYSSTYLWAPRETTPASGQTAAIGTWTESATQPGTKPPNRAVELRTARRRTCQSRPGSGLARRSPLAAPRAILRPSP